MEKTMKARVQHKHDVEANWLKATNFTPLASEIIVYDPDENYDYPRIKIGDGKTNINILPFVTKDYAKISDIPTKPEDIGALPDSTVIPTVPTKISAFENDKGYLTQHQSLDAYAKTADLGALATKDSLTASDVGALPDTTKIPSTLSDLTTDSTHRTVTDTEKNTWNAKANVSDIPTKVSDLTNDKGYITSYTETDPTVPSWAKAATKPSYTASEVGALPSTTKIPGALSDLNEDTTHRVVTDEEKEAWNAKSNFSGNYADLNGKPTIPTVPTKVSAFTNDAGYLTEHQDISHKLDASALPTAINTALEQAKESGEFDGTSVTVMGVIDSNEDGGSNIVTFSDGKTLTVKNGSKGSSGYTPVKGKDYFDGEDGSNGVSATHSWNGTVLTVTSASGTSSADLKGAKGDKGDKGDSIKGDKGDKGDTGATGATGQRGTGLLAVTTAPSSYATEVGGITPKYRMSISTIKTQSGVTEVLLGDTVRYSYYHYPIAYLDASYAYFTTRVSIRGATGAAGADGLPGTPGSDGVDGYTPIKGVDYYTDAEKAEWEAYIATELAKRGQLKPEFANSIEECTDTSKLYVLPDGYIYAYMLTEKEVESGPAYTNLLPLAKNTDRTTIYNGKGYKEGTKLSGSGGGESAVSSALCASGFIPAVAGDVLRIKGISPVTSSTHYVVAYNSSNERTGNTTLYFGSKDGVLYFQSKAEAASAIYTIDDDVITLTLTKANFGSGFNAIRISAKMDANTIVTINEEIKEGGGTTIVTEYTWTNTGHAFVPADYEDRIIAVEDKADANAAEIANLKENGVAASSASLMFISPDGNDNNDGLTEITPKKTVKACVNAGATRISAKRGVYKEILSLKDIGELEIFPTDNDLTYVAGENREPIVFDTSDTVAVSSLATYNSIKRVAYSNSANTQFDKVFIKKSQTPLYGGEYGSRYNATIWLLSEDEKTVCIKLKPVLTVAECEAEANTFTYVSGYIYINASMTSVAKIVVPTNWDCGIYINGAERFALKEVEVRFAGSYNIDIRNCAYFDFYKCACKYTSYGSGFHPFNSNGVMTACYTTKNYDGYGISGYGHTTYIDCISEFNFDDGMSHHNGTEGTVIGGRYEGNGKGGITPAYGAKVNIYGGIYKNNGMFGIGYLWASGLEPANGIIQNAVMIANPVGLTVNTNCNVTATDCIYKNNTADKDIKGNLTEFSGSHISEGENNDSGNGNTEPEVGFTNMIPLSINTDGSLYVGDNGEAGYRAGYRVSSSGTEKEAAGYSCTGFIPVVAGDVIRIKNVPQHTSSNDGNGYAVAYYFNSDFGRAWGGTYLNNIDNNVDYSNGIHSFTIPDYSDIAYIRVSLLGVTGDTILTVNQEITENSGSSGSGSTGDSSNDGSNPEETLEESLDRIKNWKYPIHEDAPVFLLETDKPAISSNDQTTEAIYAKYDALMNANPGFVTKVDCGMASDGATPIYVYHFKEAEPHYSTPLWSETKPVILICSGVHPTEQSGVHSLYHAMEEITTNPKLRDLRRNVHFIVMPMINPTAFNDSTYGVRNPDGIQVHYNFEVDFKYPMDSGYVANGNRNHGGEVPLSIPETQYFDALMEEYKDNLAIVISCHNNDIDEQYGTGFIWCSCATHFMCNLGFRFVDKMSAAWREKHGTAFDEGVRWANEYALAQAEAGSSLFNSAYTKEQPEWDYRVGRASISGSGGTEYKQALKYGVHGINVEVCDRCMILDKDFGKKRTANVVTMGTETYINFFRTFMAIYDPKNKKDYAPNLPRK